MNLYVKRSPYTQARTNIPPVGRRLVGIAPFVVAVMNRYGPGIVLWSRN